MEMTEKTKVSIPQQSDKNSLNLIRLLAALQVFFGHAQAHLDTTFLPKIVLRVLAVFQGVPIFFVLSGFLIWYSIGKTKDFKTFCKKRLFRLYPELWCGVGVNFVLIAVVLADKIDWIPYLAFQMTQGTFLQFWTPDCLRIYGCGTPNGSLWTICTTVQAYLVMWFLYRFLHGKSKGTWVVADALCIALSFTPNVAGKFLPEILAKLYGQTFVPYLFLFMIGMTLSEFFAQIISFLKKFWYLFALATLAVRIIDFDFYGSYGVLRSLFVAPAVIGFAYWCPRVALRYDYSYGIYIYHMIVVNAMIYFGITGDPWNIPLALLCTLLLAVLSYHTIGMLSRKKRNAL